MIYNKRSLLGIVGSQPISLPPATLWASFEHARRIAASLGSHDPESSLAAYWSFSTRIQQWQQIIDRVTLAKAGQLRFVEVGSGMGLFVLTGKALGFDVVGVESSTNRYESSLGIARSLFQANALPLTLIQAYSETLPLPSASVDVVASFQTFEHVAELRNTLSEIRRILKPGGLLFAQAPNYRSFYEAHYGIFAPLALGKSWLKLYLRLRGRPTEFLAHLQWLSPAALRTMARDVGFSSIEIMPIPGPGDSTEKLPTVPFSSPFKSRRGSVSLRLAYLLARLFKVLRVDSELYPQLQIWATA
ncbi:MAG: class I SAM-dependent methyltransferase [Chloroflexota bacterium]|nr:class I SAM-dependent methyltransferase [Chloroflexota bacterium]